MPPHHCHHCHLNPPVDYVAHAELVKRLGEQIFGPGVRVTVRYRVEPVAEITVEEFDECEANHRRLLAEFGRHLENDPIRAVATQRWVSFNPPERRALEFPDGGTAAG
jgi:hypothetical protein